MQEILVIYHSQGGLAAEMARSVAAGVEAVEGAAPQLLQALQAGMDELTGCAGLVIVSPEYFGYMAGAVKDFFDRTFEQSNENPAVFRKPYTVCVKAGNDGSGALNSIERICRGYKFKKVFEPVVIAGDLTPEGLARCREAGQTIAAGCVCGIY